METTRCVEVSEGASIQRMLGACATFFDLFSSAYSATHPAGVDRVDFDTRLMAACERFGINPSDEIARSLDDVAR